MDYYTKLAKDNLPKERVRRLQVHLISVTVLLMLIVGMVLVNHYLKVKHAKSQASYVLSLLAPVEVNSVTKSNEAVPAIAQLAELKPIVVAVRNRDSLSRIFHRVGIDTKDAKKILAMGFARQLRALRGGQKINLILNPADKSLQQLSYFINDTDTLTVIKNNGFQAKLVQVEPVQRLQYVSSTVHGSVFSTGKKAGLPANVIRQFAKVFDNKTNFAKGVHVGDKLAVYYREFFIGDKKVRDGDIAAAELIHAGKLYRVIGFTEPTGATNFYTPQGYSLIPPFLRFPLKYRAIGDRFSMARYEPFLHIVRPHLGVDLKAPSGTPIQAASDGRITLAGVEHGYGNVIKLQHGVYTTLYAHLSRFQSGIHSGSYVKQGQLIGFVGQTGFATGPHLHYEVHINGVHYDPLKVAFPPGEMIASAYRKQFFSFARTMLAKLDMQHNVIVAMQEPGESHS